MSIWVIIVIAWAAVMVAVLALARMAARGDRRPDENGLFPIDGLGSRMDPRADESPLDALRPEQDVAAAGPPEERGAREGEIGSSR